MKKENQIKLFMSIVVFVLGTIATPIISTYMHNILSGNDFNNITSLNLCITSIKNNSNNCYLFLSLESIVILISICIFLIDTRSYRSDLIQITPNISTPIPAGQKQFDSAKWMNETEKEEVFSLVRINSNDSFINELIKVGYDDLNNVNQNNINIIDEGDDKVEK